MDPEAVLVTREALSTLAPALFGIVRDIPSSCAGRLRGGLHRQLALLQQAPGGGNDEQGQQQRGQHAADHGCGKPMLSNWPDQPIE